MIKQLSEFNQSDCKFHGVIQKILSYYTSLIKDTKIKYPIVKDIEQCLNMILDETSNKPNMFEYVLDNNDLWYVIDDSKFKYIYNENYNQFYNKINGYSVRFGKIIEEDPTWCKLGPEILDLEISVNGCPTVNGKNCKFCYKNNTSAPAKNMTLEKFEEIVSRFPKCLSSIAFGITGTKTNPDFCEILQTCREKYGIIPNYTLSGADLTDDEESNKIIDFTSTYCGAVAVSCYDGAKQLCYDTIKKLYQPNLHRRFYYGNEPLHINMHIVLSKDTLNHIFSVLEDISNKKVPGLRNVVFLRIKPVGRAKNLNTDITYDEFQKVIEYCEDHDISYGFDSCSAYNAMYVFNKMNLPYAEYCECCESSKFSSYVNVDGIYWHCSFCENHKDYKGIDVLKFKTFNDLWLSDDINKFRFFENRVSKSCQAFDLDLKEIDI